VTEPSLVGINHDIALAGFHGEGRDFIFELAGLLCGFGLVLAGYGELVLLVPADLPFFGNVFSGLAHVVAVEGVPQPVFDHGVDHFHIAHLGACAHMRAMGRQGHVFLTARQHDCGVAEHDMLRTDCDRPQARPADLVQRPSGRFDGQTGIDMRLARGVLALTGGQNLAQNGF